MKSRLYVVTLISCMVGMFGMLVAAQQVTQSALAKQTPIVLPTLGTPVKPIVQPTTRPVIEPQQEVVDPDLALEEEPAVEEEPMEEETIPAEESVDQTTPGQEPATEEELFPAENPASGEQEAPAEEVAAEEKPASQEEPALEEPVGPDEAAVSEEEPVPGEEPASGEEPAPEEEPAAEEEPTEEEPVEEEPTEEEATEEEEAEEEAEGPKGFVDKWEDIGFDFSELEVSALPDDVAKAQADVVMPEVAELDITFDDIGDVELRYFDPAKKIEKKPGLLVQLPIIGDIILEPVLINEEHGYKFTSLPGRGINAGILIINTYSMSLIGQSISFLAEGSLLGKRGKLYLRQITPSGLVPAITPPPGTISFSPVSSVPSVPKETKGDVDQMIMSFVYDDKEKPKITIGSLGDLILDSTDIIFQKDKPILVVGKAQMFGVQAEVGLALTKMRVNAFINVQGRVQEKCKDAALKDTPDCQDLKFEDVIPQISDINKSIGQSKIKDLVLKINNLIVFKVAQKVTQRITQTSGSDDYLKGVLTATINLLGTDLATDPDVIIKEVSAKRPVKKNETANAVYNPLEATIEMSFDKSGYQGSMSAGALYIKNLGKIESPTITTSLNESDKFIEITGGLVVPVKDSPPLRITPIEIRMATDGLRLSGTIPEFTYQEIHLKNLVATFDSMDKSLTLESTKRFGDFELLVTLKVDKGDSDDDSKNAIKLTAKLITTTVCAQQAFACSQQALEACKNSEPEKKNLLAAKEKQLTEKESQAVALGAAGKEKEAEVAWKEWDTLSEEIFKQKTEITQCVTKERAKCTTQESTCTAKQTRAQAQATGRAEVEQVRAELKKDPSGKSIPEEKVEINDISFYPFKDIPGPIPAEIKSIKLTHVDVGIEVGRDSMGVISGTLYFKGKVHAFGIMVPGSLRFIYAGENKGGMVLTIDFDQRTTLAKLFPFAFSGSPYNTIYLESPKVSISTLEVASFGQISKGISISGSVPLSGGLADVGKLLGKEGKLFNLTGTFDWNNPQKSSITISIMQDAGALTTLEMCKKEFLDCVQNKTKACDAATTNTPEQIKACKEKVKPECTADQATCEKNLNEVVRLNRVSANITFQPTFSVEAGLLIRPPMQKDKPIEAVGSMSFGIDTANISAYMRGTWHDAFGLKGWEMSDVAIRAGQKYGSPIPTELGGAGRIKIVGESLAVAAESLGKQVVSVGQQALSLAGGPDIQKELASKPIFQGKTAQEAEKVLQDAMGSLKKTVSAINLTMEAAFVADVGLTNMAFEFKTTKIITWAELLIIFCSSFFEAANNKQAVEKLKFIDTLLLKISDVHGSYSPLRDVIIGAKTIPRGMTLAFAVDIWGKKGRCKMQLRDDGLEGIATFDKIDTPYFKLTGAGEDKILGNADDAPIMRVALNILKQEFYIDGQVELIIPQLGNIKSLTRINIGFDEFRVLMQGNVFNLFSADLEAKISSDPKDIFIKGKIQHNSFTMIEKLLKDAAKALNEQARKDIDFAKQEVRKLSSSELTAANRKALKQAKDNVQQSLQELNALKSRLDAVVRACGS